MKCDLLNRISVKINSVKQAVLRYQISQIFLQNILTAGQSVCILISSEGVAGGTA